MLSTRECSVKEKKVKTLFILSVTLIASMALGWVSPDTALTAAKGAVEWVRSAAPVEFTFTVKGG